MSIESTSHEFGAMRFYIAMDDVCKESVTILGVGLDYELMELLTRTADGLGRRRQDRPERGNGTSRVIKPLPRSRLEERLYGEPASSPIIKVGKLFETRIQEYGMQHEIPMLASWTNNHIIVNYMHPPGVDIPAELFWHVDPSHYSGVAIVVSCGAGILRRQTHSERTGFGDIELLACRDLAEYLEIGQEGHGALAVEDRISILYVCDIRPPQSIGKILLNRMGVHTKTSSY